MYYAYLAFNEGITKDYWNRKPIAMVDFVKNFKDAKQRVERLLIRHSDVLPATGWKDRIIHHAIDTNDNRVIEDLKKDIRLQLATLSLKRNGERRLWARTPGAPAGCYRLDFSDANGILQSAIRQSGLYKVGA